MFASILAQLNATVAPAASVLSTEESDSWQPVSPRGEQEGPRSSLVHLGKGKEGRLDRDIEKEGQHFRTAASAASSLLGALAGASTPGDGNTGC